MVAPDGQTRAAPAPNEDQLDRTSLVQLTLAIWLPLGAVSLWWVWRDRQPQGADQANHLMHALEWSACFHSLNFAQCGSLWLADAGVYSYPPLYHLLTGGFLLFGVEPDVAGVLTNLVFLGLLIYGVIRIGQVAFGCRAGVAAAILAAMFPILAQFQHEAFIDFALTGATTWCVWRLIATEGFARREASVAFGASVGLGLLLKQLLPLYLLGPVVACLWIHRRNRWRTMLENMGLSIAATVLVALPWYGPHWRSVVGTGVFNQQVAAIEGDPMPSSLSGALYYLQAMVSEQVGFATVALLLLVLLLMGGSAWRSRRTGTASNDARHVVTWWAVAGLLLVTIAILNKDIRYSMPILPAIALIAASPLSWIESRPLRAVFAGSLALCALPYYGQQMFSWPNMQRDVGFRTGPVHWTIWHQDDPYYGSSPRQDDWSLTDIVFRMFAEKPTTSANKPVRLALVPYLLRLNPNALRLEAMQCGVSLEVHAVGNERDLSEKSVVQMADFVFTKTGDQGLEFLTAQASAVDALVAARSQKFERLETYRLPDGSLGTLYRVIR